MTKKNIAAPDPLNPELFTAAIGEAQSKGWEVDVAGVLLPGWQVIANFAYTDTIQLSEGFVGAPGNIFPNVPRYGGRLWTTYTVPFGADCRFVLGGGVTARSERQGDFANSFQLPGYATVDLMAACHWKLGSVKGTAQVNIENLLNQQYYAASGEFGTSRILAGAPFSILFSLKLAF